MADHWNSWAKYIIDSVTPNAKAVAFTDKAFTSVWNTEHKFNMDAANLKIFNQAFAASGFPTSVMLGTTKHMFVKKIDDDAAMYMQMIGSEDTKEKFIVFSGKGYCIVVLANPKADTSVIIATCKDVFTKLVI